MFWLSKGTAASLSMSALDLCVKCTSGMEGLCVTCTWVQGFHIRPCDMFDTATTVVHGRSREREALPDLLGRKLCGQHRHD